MATYFADSANGDHIDDPLEDDIYMVIDDLDAFHNAFVVLQPAGEDPAWHVSVTLLDRGEGYEVVLRDLRAGEERVMTRAIMAGIANDIILWLNERDIHPRRYR